MANFLALRWTKMESQGNTPAGFYFESNLVRVKGHSAIHIEAPGVKGIDISYLQSLTGERFVSFNQDYFGELHVQELPIFGVGQVVKFRVNKLPAYAVIIGEDVVDAGNPNPEEILDVVEGFAGSEGEYFRGIDTQIFAGKP